MGIKNTILPEERRDEDGYKIQDNIQDDVA